MAYLRSLVTPSGAVRYSRTSAQTPVWVTAQALAALARKPFPLASVPRRVRRSAAPPTAPAQPAPAPHATATASVTAPPHAKAATATPAPTTPQGELGPPTPPGLAPRMQAQARLLGYLTAALLASVA
jgi:hypothetical protein